MSQIKVRGKMQRIAVINENRVVAKAVRYSTVKQDELTSYAAQSSHIPESTLRACTLAMREAISYFVLNGHHVDLGKFGILGVRSSQKAATDAEEVSANLVKRVTIGFTPSKEIKDAIAANKSGRADEPEVKEILKDIFDRADEYCKAERLYREGKLPKRICHCDTKVDNILFDKDDNVLCVIDLDTVMPSFIFSDFGDFLRSAANTTVEDDPDLSKVSFNFEIFKSFTKGYLKGAASFITPIEIENLPFATALFPYMTLVRFIADYINGDVYFHCKYPEHNLVRSRNQLKLTKCVEAAFPQMEDFIAEQLKV